MKKIKSASILTLLILAGYTSMAQTTGQKIGTNPTIKDASAVLELEATNKGVLMPRVSLTSTADNTTVPSSANALTVFNTATAGDVTPGYYYWDLPNLKWVRLLDTKTGWQLLGNTGTSSALNFVGTTDAQDLVFRTANTERLRITQTGRLDFSNTSPVTGAAVNMATNIFVEGGNETTTGSRNTAVGTNALLANTSGTGNTVLGNNALMANTSGNSNVALGFRASLVNTTGSSNIAIGDNAFPVNTTGSQNIAIGNSALSKQTTSNGNIGIGIGASNGDKFGNYNTIIGHMVGSGNAATWGDQNVLLGYTTGNGTRAAGNQNIIIGPFTRLAEGVSNSLNIGWGIFGTNLLNNERYFSPYSNAGGGGVAEMRVDEDIAGGKIGIMTPTPNSTLQVAGSVSMPIRTIPNANYGNTVAGFTGIPETTINANDYKIIIRNNGTTNISLPDPTTCKGRIYVVQNMIDATDVIFDRDIETGGGAIITVGASALNLGNTTNNFTYGYTITLQSDGTVWTGITQ